VKRNASRQLIRVLIVSQERPRSRQGIRFRRESVSQRTTNRKRIACLLSEDELTDAMAGAHVQPPPAAPHPHAGFAHAGRAKSTKMT
jgi:hypothetical protein